ncbi:hypothetical protein BST46_28160 [Mycobacterium timonense]|uniref:Uncharacterized protein n=1 Tax=Mycobacterium timonense TaxID=701043 RepID=A0ABX3TDA9_9MYCO|nr:hypothetical protein BST46_28160 [Mycobacterium timonense]
MMGSDGGPAAGDAGARAGAIGMNYGQVWDRRSPFVDLTIVIISPRAPTLALCQPRRVHAATASVETGKLRTHGLDLRQVLPVLLVQARGSVPALTGGGRRIGHHLLAGL